MRTDRTARRVLLAVALALSLVGVALSAAVATDPPAPAPAAAEGGPFEAEIRAFEAADAKRPPQAGGVLFVGSSSIRLWTTLAEDFPGLPVINRGFGGSQIADSTRYADRIVLPYKPKTIVLYAGDNDVAAGKTPEQVLADFKAFVAKVRPALPDTRVLFISIKPSTARWHLVDKIREANRLVREFAGAAKGDGRDEKGGGDEEGGQGAGKLGYVDIFTPMLGGDGKPRAELLGPDGLHLNEKGYALWREVVAAAMKG